MNARRLVNKLLGEATWHSTDAWRGYSEPKNAVAGASDCGSWSDSPAPTAAVEKELNQLRNEALRPAGIQSRLVYTRSSNAFMAKRWIVVSPADFAKARDLAADWLEKNHDSTRYVHAPG